MHEILNLFKNQLLAGKGLCGFNVTHALWIRIRAASAEEAAHFSDLSSEMLIS
jgi:hypothetical protein